MPGSYPRSGWGSALLALSCRRHRASTAFNRIEKLGGLAKADHSHRLNDRVVLHIWETDIFREAAVELPKRFFLVPDEVAGRILAHDLRDWMPASFKKPHIEIVNYKLGEGVILSTGGAGSVSCYHRWLRRESRSEWWMIKQSPRRDLPKWRWLYQEQEDVFPETWRRIMFRPGANFLPADAGASRVKELLACKDTKVCPMGVTKDEMLAHVTLALL